MGGDRASGDPSADGQSCGDGPWGSLPVPLRKVEDVDAAGGSDAGVAHGRALLAMQDLFCRVAEIDPDRSTPLPVSVSETLRRVDAYFASDGFERRERIDSTMLVAAWASRSIGCIVRNPRQRMRRQHAMLGLSKVREVDVRGLQWLARQPGATVREKLGRVNRMLGIVRPWVPDTHENRVAVRVIAELRAIFARRGGDRRLSREPRSGEVLDCVSGRLDNLQHVCFEDFGRSPLVDVPAATAFTPNNVLLGDRDYRRVWTLANAVCMREEHFAAIWRYGAHSLAAATMLAVEANLARRSNTHVAGGWLEVIPGGHEGCSVTALSGIRWWLCNLREAQGQVFGLSIAGDTINCRLGAIAESGDPADEGFEDVSLRVGFCAAGHASPDTTFTCTIRRPSGEESSPAFSIPRGLAECAGWIVDRLGVHETPEPFQPRFLSRSGGTLNDRPSASLPSAIGVDVFGAGLLISGEATAAAYDLGPSLSALWTVRDREHWVAGAEAAVAPRDVATCRVHAVRSLFPVGEDDLPREPALHQVLGLVESYVAPGADWAIAIPDNFDEVDCQTIRAAMPARAGGATLIWRSVAAALRWRVAEPSAPLGDGDRLVVVDGEASGLMAVPLVARFEDGTLPAGDRLWWERAAVAAPLPTGRTANSSAWLACRARAAVLGTLEQAGQDTTQRDSATLDSLVEQIRERELWEAGRWCWVQSDRRGPLPCWHRVRCNEADEEVADQEYAGRFEQWLTAWSESSSGEVLRGTTGESRLRWHFVGRPFDRPGLQREIAAGIERQWPGAECSFASDVVNDVAKGANEYLRRHGRGLPTWRDILPDLYLDVGDGEPIALFGRKIVRPGEECEEKPKQIFQIPPNRDVILLPLMRDKDSRKPVSFTARLASKEHFPLRKAVRVKAEVRYRHAQDGFRIRLVPQGEAPFIHLEVAWVRSGAKAAGAPTNIRNEEPQFPEAEPWELPEDALTGFTKAVRTFDRSCRDTVSADNGRRMHQKRESDVLVEAVRQCIHAIEQCDQEARRVWAGNREETEAPPSIRKCLSEQLLPWAAAILNTDSLGCARASMPKSFRKVDWPQVASAWNKLQVSLRRLLSRMRYDVSPTWLREEYAAIRELPMPREDDLYRLARLMDCRDCRKAEEIIRWALARLSYPGSSGDAKEAKPYLAMLVVGLWSHRELAKQISEDLAENCLSMCESMVQATSTRWSKQPAAGDVHAETCAIILSLLRRRGLSGGERYAAGIDRMQALANTIARTDRELRSAGYEVRSRLTLGGEAEPGDYSLIADEVCAALRGERAAVIKAITDE
jgi:hypothetical protein